MAVGVLLPYFTSHMFGMPGTILLPMHIPVLLIGIICGPTYGAVCGIIIPILNMMLTGMPTVYPMLPIMTGELMAYGLISGLIYKKSGRIYLSMVPAMVCGRVIYGLIFAVLTLASGQLQALSVTSAFVQGLPGIVIQLIIIPIIVKAVFYSRQNSKYKSADKAPVQLSDAKKLIGSGAATCVVMRDGLIVRQASGKGVKPILGFWENEPKVLSGAQVADKIIGKAAAMLLTLADVQYIYGEVMSVAARAYLQRCGIAFSYGRCIDVISNRAGNGICPLEQSVADIEDPEEAYLVLKATIAKLMSVG